MRVLVRFNDAREAMPGWVDWLTLSAETPEGRTPLLTLAWPGVMMRVCPGKKIYATACLNGRRGLTGICRLNEEASTRKPM